MTQRPSSGKGKDGWSTEETQLNKLGTWIILIPTICAAIIPWIADFQLPMLPTVIVIGVCGLIGGIVNIYGRGPMAAGAVVGLVMALGAYGAVVWWVHDRKSVRKFELAIAFTVGALPGLGLQYLLQVILKKRAAAA
jgi:hypothetical protein